MAEFVEQNIQEMIPEIEEFEKLELLTPSEIKKLIQKRRYFEYQVAKRKKEKQNYINYVLYDIKLIELIALRQEKLNMTMNENKMECPMSKRVIKRLKLMSRLWPSHPDIWQLRISFARSRIFLDEVSTAYFEQIRYHGNDENLWVAWAQWEIEGRNNFDKARTILLSKAPLYHPESLLITKEYFRLELLFIESLRRKSENTNLEGLEEIAAENREKVLNCGIPETVYENAADDFSDDVQFYLAFYSVASHFPFAGQLSARIYSDMVQEFPTDPHVWRLKGKLLLQDVKIGNEGEEEGEKEEKTEEVEKDKKDLRTPQQKLTALLTLYDEAMTSSGFSFVAPLVQDLVRLLSDAWGVDALVVPVCARICQVLEVHSEQLSPIQFLIWFQVARLLKQSPEKLSLILKKAKSSAPSCLQIQLESHRLGINSLKKLNQKEKLEIISNLSGEIGAEICESLIRNSEKKGSLLKRALNHPDVALTKAMRLKCLQSFKGPKKCRKLYSDYKSVPPFCAELHLVMLKKELSRKVLAASHIRQVFDLAIEQFGWEAPELWLCYLEFERKKGEAKRVLSLNRELELKMNPERMNHFVDYKFAIETSLSNKIGDGKQPHVFVDCPDRAVKKEEHQFWRQSSLPPLLDEEPSLMHSTYTEKEKFFETLAGYVEGIKDAEKPSISKAEKDERKIYEEILSLIHGGEKVSLQVKRVAMDAIGVEKETREFVDRIEREFRETREIRNETYSTKLQFETQNTKPSCTSGGEISKILQTSKTLEPGFLQQRQIIPYYLSKQYVKSLKKKVSGATAGKGWFDMKAPELTDEVKRDLEVLRMRSVLDPQRHYKRNDMKEIPKFFQMGKVIDSPMEFYSSRVPKRERKANMAEEIINDEEVLRYQKRKYDEIIERKESKKRKVMKANKAIKNKSKKKAKIAKRKE